MQGRFLTASEINITYNSVEKLLLKLKPNKESGSNNIRPKILKKNISRNITNPHDHEVLPLDWRS